MSKVITIKLTKSGANVGPFTITDEFGTVLATDVPKNVLVSGISYTVDDAVTMVILESTGSCKATVNVSLQDIHASQIYNTKYVQTVTACLWRHLTNPELYNFFYGNIESYIIE